MAPICKLGFNGEIANCNKTAGLTFRFVLPLKPPELATIGVTPTNKPVALPFAAMLATLELLTLKVLIAEMSLLEPSE